LSEKEEIKESTSTGEASGENSQACNPPEPAVAGNEHLEVISHNLLIKDGNEGKGSGVVLNLKNVAGKDIGKTVFKIVFYGAGGDIVDTLEEAMTDFGRGKIRNFRVECPKPDADIRSYAVSVLETVLTPEPEAAGNDKVAILKHGVHEADPVSRGEGKCSIDLAIRNISDKTFATIVFEAVFSDGEGKVLETVRHKELELKPNSSRAVLISPAKDVADAFKTYRVSVLRTVTTDVEKVQLRRHEIRSAEGGEEVRGIVKNISDVKTDTALVATFKDSKDEKIGTRVVFIKDIEPGTAKQFHFIFNTPQGESVRSYTLSVGEMAEEDNTPVVPPAAGKGTHGCCC
jgi:hypothetical protein